MQLKHVLQWRLALVAGLVAGLVFLLVNILYVSFGQHLGTWTVVRYMASIVMGERVVPPPASFDPVIVGVGLLVNFVLAIIYAFILAAIIHRWGLLVGIVGGALFGAALYVINLYTFTLFYPWFFALNSLPFFVSHVLLGAVAGGVYELLDYDDAPFLSQPTRGGVRP
jgi:hypothetical protein